MQVSANYVCTTSARFLTSCMREKRLAVLENKKTGTFQVFGSPVCMFSARFTTS
jgi:hypothetical protein